MEQHFAAMAELADALDSGSSRGNSVKVRVLLAAYMFQYTNEMRKISSKLSAIETAFVKINQNSLADLIRAVRLQNPYPVDSAESMIWNEQCQLNLPLLIHASLYLDAFCQKLKKTRILFTFRDGCLWIQLFQKLFPQYDSIPFFCSRHTYSFPTPSFIEYVQEVYSKDAIIVDGHGQGLTCERFFIEHLKKSPTYLSIINSGNRNHAILRGEQNERLEKINYDLTGVVFDVQDGKPRRCQPEYDLRFIRPSHACIAKSLEIIPDYCLHPFDMEIIKMSSDAIYSGLVIDQFVDHAVFHAHLPQGDRTYKHIHHLRGNSLLETD